MPHLMIVFILYTNILNLSWIIKCPFEEYGAFKIHSGIANSADPDQTAPSGRSSLIWVCTICLCNFVTNFLVYQIMGHLPHIGFGKKHPRTLEFINAS